MTLRESIGRSPQLRHTLYLVIVLAVAAVCLLTRLDGSRFWDQDEGYFASTAAEMYTRGEWIVPTFNGQMFGHKPPWMYWMMMTGFSIFGVGEQGARIMPALFGIATALLTFQLGRRLFTPRVGLFAGLVMASCLMFSVVSRAAVPDGYLVFFSALSLYWFATTGFAKSGTAQPGTEPASINSWIPDRQWQWALIYGVMALAVLVKGPIGFLFPMAVIGLFLLFMTPATRPSADASRAQRLWASCRRFGPLNFLQTVWRMRPLTALVMILLVAGPWYLLVGIRTSGAFHAEFFGVHHYQRFVTPMDNHSGPIYYYLIAILVGLFPWSIYGGPAVLEWFRQIRAKSIHYPALVFLGCWVAVYVVLFSIAGTKLPNYVLPAYPALAVLTGFFVDRALGTGDAGYRKLVAVSVAGLAITGLAISVGIPLTLSLESGGQSILYQWDVNESVGPALQQLVWMGLPLLAGGIAAWWLAVRGRLMHSVGTATATTILFTLLFWNSVVPGIDPLQSPQHLVQKFRMERQHADNARLAEFGCFRPSLVFYSGGHLEQCRNAAEVGRHLAGGHDAWLLTDSEHISRLDPLRDRFEIVSRAANFPERGELLLLRGRVALAGQDPLPRR